MIKRKWLIFNHAPCGSIGNVDVYKIANGYALVDQYDNGKFLFVTEEGKV